MEKTSTSIKKIGEFCSSFPRKKDTGLISDNGIPDMKLIIEKLILYRDILFVSKLKNDNIVKFHLVNRTEVYYNENSLSKILKSTNVFIQTSRGIIINAHKIVSANSTFTTLYLGEKKIKINVSRGYKSKVKHELSKLYFL